MKKGKVVLVLLGILVGTVGVTRESWAYFNSAKQVTKLFGSSSSWMSNGYGLTAGKVIAVGASGIASRYAWLKFLPSHIGLIYSAWELSGALIDNAVVNGWLEDTGWQRDQDGDVMKPGEDSYSFTSGAPGIGQNPFTYGGITYTIRPVPSTFTQQGDNCGFTDAILIGKGWDVTKWTLRRDGPFPACWTGNGGPPYTGFLTAKPTTASWVTTTQNYSPASETDLQNELAADLETGTEAAVAVYEELINKTEALVETVNDTVPQPETQTYVDPESEVELSDATVDDIQEAVNQGVQTETETELSDETDGNTTIISNLPSEWTDWEYTPEQMASAQYTKDKQLSGEEYEDYVDNVDDNITSEDDNYTLPEVETTVTETLTWYQNYVNGLPFIGWITDQVPEVGTGNAVITLPIPDAWGSDLQVDFSEYEDHLDWLGSALYAITWLGCMLWLIKGRGD